MIRSSTGQLSNKVKNKEKNKIKINRARTEEEEFQNIIINIRRIIRIIRTLYFIFRITASFQNQFISVVIKYYITTSAEIATGFSLPPSSPSLPLLPPSFFSLPPSSPSLPLLPPSLFSLLLSFSFFSLLPPFFF